jgi:glycosyl transferase family 2
MPPNPGIPPIGNDPIAAVFGGIVFLLVSAGALVLWKERLREGRLLEPRAWAAAGAIGGAALYATGLLAIGRGPELAAGGMLADVPWALMLISATGAFVAYAAGARAGWHAAGVAVLGSLVLACTGWAAYLVTSRVADFLKEPSVFSGALVGLLFAQLVALLLVCAVAAYMLDGLVRRRWARAASLMPYDSKYRPAVAVHIACYNEPPGLVLSTIDSILAQDYPRDRLHVMLVDDSTDAAAVATLRAACAERGVTFLHRDHRAGFKAGALNGALRATPREVELIAVVDADFVVEPGFLRETVGYFADRQLSFLQTKLALRGRSRRTKSA